MQGIWLGMLSGTCVQTIILFLIVWKTNWNKEVIRDPNQTISLDYIQNCFRNDVVFAQASVAEERIRKWGGPQHDENA